MAITRRQFLKRTGAAAAGAVLGPSLFENLFVRQALASRANLMSVKTRGPGDGGRMAWPARATATAARTATPP